MTAESHYIPTYHALSTELLTKRTKECTVIHYERYMAFHEKWHKELLSGNYEAYDRFRHDYSRLAAYVVDHAFTVWSEHRDKWGLIKEFAANYAKSIETGQDLLFPERVAKWSNHGRLVQNLMVGAQ